MIDKLQPQGFFELKFKILQIVTARENNLVQRLKGPTIPLDPLQPPAECHPH